MTLIFQPFLPSFRSLLCTATTGGGVLYSSRCPFFTENSKFRPILASLLRIHALFGVVLQGCGFPKLTNIRCVVMWLRNYKYGVWQNYLYKVCIKCLKRGVMNRKCSPCWIKSNSDKRLLFAVENKKKHIKCILWGVWNYCAMAIFIPNFFLSAHAAHPRL